MMRGVFAVVSLNLDKYFDLRYTTVYNTSINSQKEMVSELISYNQIGKEVTK